MGNLLKLYISVETKDKWYMNGSIYNRPRKNNSEIYLRYRAERHTSNLFELSIYKVGSHKVYQVMLDETIDCSMTAKDILYYVDQRIEMLWEQL